MKSVEKTIPVNKRKRVPTMARWRRRCAGRPGKNRIS